MEMLFTFEKGGRRVVVRGGNDGEAVERARQHADFLELGEAVGASAITAREEVAGWEEFEEKYRPVANTLRQIEDGEPPEMFETFADEFDFVQSRAESGTVWTLVEGDDGIARIMPGLRVVNRIGHFVTELACADEQEEYVF